MATLAVRVVVDGAGLPWGVCPECRADMLLDDRDRLMPHGEPGPGPLCPGGGRYPTDPTSDLERT